jgi:apoptosis-inducing factor 3
MMADIDWQKIIRDTDLKEGVPAECDLEKNKVLLVRLNGAIYACGGKCTHYGAPLEKGFLRGNILTCPWHNARFDVTSGRMNAAPALSHLKCYETKVANGDVYIRAAAKTLPAVRQDTIGRTFVIIGAGAAGNAAAETLRDEGFSGRLVLVTPEDSLPYDRPALSKDFLAGKSKSEWIPLHSKKFYDERRIELLTGRKATAIDSDIRTVFLDNGEKLSWDCLLLATGAKPRSLRIPGQDLKSVFSLRSFRDAEAIVKASEEARSAAVIGASFIGLEAASALRQRNLDVTIIAPEKVPLVNVFGEEIGMWLKALHEGQGVKFYLGRKPVEVVGSEKVEGVRLDDGTLIAADLVVAGIGVEPITEYLSGTDLVKENGVPVNTSLQTSIDGIFAAGDIAAIPYGPLKQRIRVEHWAVAERQGQHAARAMLGSAEPYREVPFFWTRQYDTSLCYLGWAKTFDRIAFRGAPGDEGFLAGFYEKTKLLAVASVRRNVEFMILGELIKDGVEVAFDQFKDEKMDLLTLLPEKK